MKDPYSLFIGESVDLVKNDYYKLMFKTKLTFFQALQEGKDVSYFQKEIDKIWKGTNYDFMKQRMEELEAMVSEGNIGNRKIVNPSAKFEEVFKIDSKDFYKKTEDNFKEQMIKYYDNRLETINNGYVDKEKYMTDLVERYDKYQNSIPYLNADGTIRSYHNLADYNSMVYNTNLTKSAWNRTYYDADLLNNDLVYLPAHTFACPLCIESQGKVYSISGNSKKYPPQQVAIDRGVGHPHCKHTWTLYWGKDQLQDNKFNDEKWDERYKEQQKARAIQLKKAKLNNDRKIYESIGNMEKADKTKKKVAKLNSQLKDLNITPGGKIKK